MGTSWFGIIVEVDGVLLSNKNEAQKKAWLETAEKLGKPRPLVFQLERAAHARNDVAVGEIFKWARERDAVKRISAIKDEIFRKLVKNTPDVAQPGVQTFLQTLKSSDVPVAAVSTHSRHDVEAALADAGLRNAVTQIVAEEDFYDRLDMYNYASQLIQRPPVRCIVVGTSNTEVEVAHHCGMKCVVVAPPSQPTYELASADLVSRDIGTLRFTNLRNLFSNEEGREPQPQLEPEAELETDVYDHWR
jgi:beta-phosphoglucomutase-like phosphatase (HAD superfamily)